MKPSATFRTLAFICILVTVLGTAAKVPLSGSESRTPVEQPDGRAFSRLVASYELARIHAREMHEDEDAHALWDKLYKDLAAESGLDASWTMKIIPRSPDRSLAVEVLGPEAVEKLKERDYGYLTDFERRAIKQLEQGRKEVLESPSPGVLRYLRPIRPVAGSCALCHKDDIEDAKISLQILFGRKPDNIREEKAREG